jgi:hypothetical protein
VPAKNLYDVSQALAWVATNWANPEERLERQSLIYDLITKLAAVGADRSERGNPASAWPQDLQSNSLFP